MIQERLNLLKARLKLYQELQKSNNASWQKEIDKVTRQIEELENGRIVEK